MDILSMSKKELKEYVNKNGAYFHMDINSITRDEMDKYIADNAIKTGRKVPEGENIIIFKGLASQRYKKGEKNRNGYKIDVEARQFDSYKENPIILFQHNSDYGGIGHAVAFNAIQEGLEILFYVDLNTLEERNAYQVKNGYVNAMSTGHITREFMIEDNKTGKRYTLEEAEKEGIDVFEVLFRGSDKYTMVVTKAEMVENSLVTIGSNDKAKATLQNAIQSQLKNQFLNKEYLLNNLDSMNKDTLERLLTIDGLSQETIDLLKVKLNSLNENTPEPPKEDEKEETDDEKEEEKEETTQEEQDNNKDENSTESEETNEELEEKEEEKLDDDSEKVDSKEDPEEAEDSTEAENAETTENVEEDKADENNAGSVETNTLVENVTTLTNAVNELVEENKKLKEENAELVKTMQEAETLINTLTPIVERAKKFEKKQGLNFTGDVEENSNKSILEKRIKWN